MSQIYWLCDYYYFIFQILQREFHFVLNVVKRLLLHALSGTTLLSSHILFFRHEFVQLFQTVSL